MANLLNVTHVARKQRAAALKDRWAARDRVATFRDAFGPMATNTLRQAFLRVSLKYSQSAYSPAAAD